MVYLGCRLCRSARRAETVTRCGKNTVLKWLTFNYERWNHLTSGLCVCERDRERLKVKSYFLRLQWSQNFTFTLSGLALSTVRLLSLMKPEEVHPFLTWAAPPRRKSPSKSPADPWWEGARAGAARGHEPLPPAPPVIGVFSPSSTARAEIKLGKGKHLNNWPLWAGSWRGRCASAL